MAILRYAIHFSYVFFIVLLIGTILLYEPLELTQEWLLAMLVPAILLALAAFVVLPLYDWLRLPRDQKRRIPARHVLYRMVLALVLLFVPVGLARPALNVPDPTSDAILVAVLVLFCVNTGMLLYADYFIGEADSS